MAKKRKHTAQTRDAPATPSSWLCSVKAYDMLCAGGYRRLADCPEVRMCVDVYAQLISNMTVYLMRNTDQGDVRVRNELARIVDIEPHPLLTHKAFYAQIVETMLLEGDGNAVVLPYFRPDGLPERLQPLKPSQVVLQDTPDGLSYTIQYLGKTYRPDEVLHFAANPDPDRPWIGRGYRTQMAEVAKALRQANTTKEKIMQSPAPSIIVKVDGLSEDFASLEGRKKLRAQYLDSSEAGEPWFIPAEEFAVETVKPMSLNDLAIAKNLEIDKRTMAGIMGVPAFLVGIGEFHAEEFNNFIATRVLHYAKIIEQTLTRGLLWDPAEYWHLNPRSLYSYSLAEIVSAGSAMVDRMAMRRNEWRDWLGMPPDPEMDELLALENYIPAARLGDQKKLNQEGGE